MVPELFEDRCKSPAWALFTPSSKFNESEKVINRIRLEYVMGFKVTTVRLPHETLDELSELSGRLSKDRSELMREVIRLGLSEVKLRFGLEEYQAARMSIGRLAEFTGLGYHETLMELKKRGVQLRYGEDRLQPEA